MAGRHAKTGIRGVIWRRNTYWFSITVNGKRTWHNLRTADLAQAIKNAAAYKTEEIQKSESFSSDVDRFIRYQVEHDNWTENSVGSKSTILKAFVRSLPPLFRTTSVDATRLKTWLTGLKHKQTGAPITASTIDGYLTTFKSFFAWAKKERIVALDPTEQVTLPKVKPAARKGFLQKNQRDALLKNCPAGDLKTALYLGFHLGLRRAEIDAARPAWFDLTNRLCNVSKLDPVTAQKMGITPFDLKDVTERMVPMTQELTDYIRTLDLTQPYLIHPAKRLRGKFRYRYDLRTALENLMTKQGHPWATFHTMRHTFASLLATDGVSLYHIAEWLGDDIRTTQKHYASLQPRHDLIEKAFT